MKEGNWVDVTNGDYRVDIYVSGYYSTSREITITKGVVEIPAVSITQTTDNLIFEFTGDNASDIVNKLYNGYTYDYDLNVTSGEGGGMTLSFMDNGESLFYGVIENGSNIYNGSTKFSENLTKVNDTKLLVAKDKLIERNFLSGDYKLKIKAYGYATITQEFTLDLGEENKYVSQVPNRVVVSEPIQILPGYNSLSSEDFQVKSYCDDKELKIYGKDIYVSPFTETFVEGKEYDVNICISFVGSLGNVGIDEVVDSVLVYDGQEYAMTTDFRGVTGGVGGMYLDCVFGIKGTVKVKCEKAPALPKVTVPTANTGLVYSGSELTGVNEGENYMVSGNKATDAGEYNATLKLNEGYMWSDGTTADKTVTWSIEKANPEYTLPEDLTATHEDSLSDVALPEGFAWKDAAQVINGVGEKEYDSIFTPADTNNYKTVDVKVKVAVAPKKVQSLVSPTAEDTVYGNKLSSVKLLLEGWAWKDGNTVPTVKNDGYEVVYTIDDDVNYDYSEIEGYSAESHSVTRKIELTVEKAEVAVTVPEFEGVYGNTLDDIKDQLTEGWSFKEALTASVGDAGVNKVTVIYTPKDTDNFKVSEKEAVLNVEKATPEYTVPTGLNATEDQKLSEVTLPDGWTWVDSEATVSDSNLAIFTPADTKNYKTVTLALKVMVSRVVEIDEETIFTVITEVGVTTENDDVTEELQIKNDALTNSVMDLVNSAANDSESKTIIEDDSDANITVSDILTDAMNAMNDGVNVALITSTEVIKNELSIDDLDKESLDLIDNRLNAGSMVLSYLDLSVQLKVGLYKFNDDAGELIDEATAEVKQLAEPLMVSVKVELPEDVNPKDYKFYVVTVHKQNGVITTDAIEATYDEATGAINFYAEQFSYYTLAYEKLPANNNNSSSSSSNGGYRAPNTFAGY